MGRGGRGVAAGGAQMWPRVPPGTWEHLAVKTPPEVARGGMAETPAAPPEVSGASACGPPRRWMRNRPLLEGRGVGGELDCRDPAAVVILHKLEVSLGIE